MNATFSELKSAALASLKGRWGISIGAILILILIMGAGNIVMIGTLLIGGPLTFGYTVFNLDIARDETPDIGRLFDGFKLFGKTLGTYILMIVYTLLWTLLFIIPGIMAGLSYAMTFYILADHPDYTPNEAIEESKAMMYGHKMRLFLLNLSFIGWGILCIFTFGIGFLWLIPYVQVTLANFYRDLKGDDQSYEEQLIDSIGS